MRTDPFTRTPGIAGNAYIDNGIADEIIENFCNDDSSKYVYKITGIRGAGKSVEYGRVIRALKEKKEWLVYPISASGDAVRTLIGKISAEKFINSKKSTTSINADTSIEGHIVSVKGKETVNIGKTFTENDNFYSDEATLVNMIQKANQKNYKVLIGVDDIARTPEMVKLLSIIGSMILEGLQVYLLVTGLSENIEDFSKEKTLTFFKRSDTKEIKALNKYDVEYMYEKLLSIDAMEARKLEALSMGYAYAYQVLGSLYFSKKENEGVSDILPDFDRIIFRDSYDLIWKSLTSGERTFIKCVLNTPNGEASEIKAQMEKPSAYSVYRDRLMNKHIIDGDIRGVLQIRLPRFDRFVEIWG